VLSSEGLWPKQGVGLPLPRREMEAKDATDYLYKQEASADGVGINMA
jgi:hypothetical protein